MRYGASPEKRKESSKREKFGCVPNQRYMGKKESNNRDHRHQLPNTITTTLPPTRRRHAPGHHNIITSLLRLAVLRRTDRQTNAEFRAFSLSVVVSASAYTTTLSLLSTISIEQLI
ncbi:Hypothetical predicted protein [Prunus dulcis]|uniref:Uncharacterized protein n=1 Tax=Prunus dulcis TaxID=3755 RepID=A0A5E4FVX3_PRUDU|nr:Hypothetical predicted protein [Prunus dulcis]